MERNLRAEVLALKEQNQDYEAEMESLRKQLIEAKTKAFDQTEAIFAKSNAQHGISKLHDEIQTKNAMLLQMEQNYATLQASQQETQLKLTSSFEMAASLRKLLEEKEIRLLELDTIKQDHDRALRTKDVQYSLLQQQFHKLQQEYLESQEKLRATQRIVQTKDEIAQKLKYEMDIFTLNDQTFKQGQESIPQMSTHDSELQLALDSLHKQRQEVAQDAPQLFMGTHSQQQLLPSEIDTEIEQLEQQIMQRLANIKA